MAQIRLIGTDPSQVPTNGMLGNLAFQNAESVSLEKLVVTSTVGINGNVTTSSGSAISYGGGETYQIWNDDPESSAVDTNGQPAAFRTLKTFVASKSGSLKFKFSAYIQSGTYYWAWRIINQASTVLSSGYYNGGLDAGQVAAVHEYRRFVASVSNVTPGDILTLQMVSATSSGTPFTGNATGQILYAKEFRAYSTTPSIDHGGSSNVWGKNVGIGVHIPGSYNLPLPPITRLDVRGPNVANNVASLGSVPPATMYVGSSSGWGQNDGGSIALGGAADSSQFTATYAGIAGRRESVHGWEYGGYLTLSTVTIGTDQLSERVRIRADGMFEVKGAGVAGTSPALSVSGSAPANSLVLNSTGTVGCGAASFIRSPRLGVVGTNDLSNDQIVIAATNPGIVINCSESGTANRGAAIVFDHGDLVAAISSSRVNTNTWETDLRFYTHPSAYTSQYTLPERMRITGSGNVGIGTVNPSYKLDVKDGTIRAKMGALAGAELGGHPSEETGFVKWAADNHHGIWFRGSVNSEGGTVTGGDVTTFREFGEFQFWTGGASMSLRMKITSAGHMLPGLDDSYDLGSTSLRWRNLYTTDLHLSNEGKPGGNQIDGTTGNWTIQEGEESLYIINNKSLKKYRFVLEEIE